MKRNTSFEGSEIYLIAAALGAQTNFLETGFRQKHLKFLVEMFSNWLDMIHKDRALAIHNTQIMRYLEHLVSEGYARSTLKVGQPHYKLTRVGLITLVGKLTEREPGFPLEQFYFIFHFVEAYREAIEALVKAEGQHFPTALKIELESLLYVSANHPFGIRQERMY